MGFFRGFVAPFRGAIFVSRERLWHLVVLPVLMNIALAGAAAWAAARYWGQELADRAIGSEALASLLFVAVTGLGAIVLFVILQPLLGAISNDILAERVERKVLGETPRPPFFASAGRAMGHAILKLVLYALAFVTGLGLPSEMAGHVKSGAVKSFAIWNPIDLGYAADGLYLGLGIDDYSDESIGHARAYGLLRAMAAAPPTASPRRWPRSRPWRRSRVCRRIIWSRF